MFKDSLAALVCVALAASALAGEAIDSGPCDSMGDVPNHIDPKLPPKIDKWATAVELKFGLNGERWPGLPADAPTAKQRESIELQALVAEWVREVEPNSSESVFRQAVMHGVMMQYFMIMAKEDPAKAADHKFWIGAEAWRANECLKLIGAQPH